MAFSSSVRAYFEKHLWPDLPDNFYTDDIRQRATADFGVVGCAGAQSNMLRLFIVGDDGKVVDVRAECEACNPAMYSSVDAVCNWGRERDFATVLASVSERAVLDDLVAAVDDGHGADDFREKAEYALYALRQAVRVHLGMALETPPAVCPAA